MPLHACGGKIAPQSTCTNPGFSFECAMRGRWCTVLLRTYNCMVAMCGHEKYVQQVQNAAICTTFKPMFGHLFRTMRERGFCCIFGCMQLILFTVMPSLPCVNDEQQQDII